MTDDDDDLSLLQPKAFFTSELIKWRVLSILTNPYQSSTALTTLNDWSSCNYTVFQTGCFGGGWVVAMMLMLMVCLVAKRRLPAGRHPSTIPYQLPYRTKHYLATYCTLRLVTPPPCSSSPVLIGTNEEVLIRIIIANIVKLYSGWFHLDQHHCMEFNQSEADLQCNIICINGKVYWTRNNLLSYFPCGLLNQE